MERYAGTYLEFEAGGAGLYRRVQNLSHGHTLILLAGLKFACTSYLTWQKHGARLATCSYLELESL